MKTLSPAWSLAGALFILAPLAITLGARSSHAGKQPASGPISERAINHLISTPPATPLMTFTVTTTADTGVGSLRAAIDQANTSPGLDLITFNLGPGIPSINVGSVTGTPLQPITDAVTIDGNTGGATRIELNGAAAGAGANGLTLMGSNITVRGLVINGFAGDGISISLGSGNVIQNTLIGTNAAGNAAVPNKGSGIFIDSTSAGNTIGGTASGSLNVISGNASNGIFLNQTGSNQVIGNFIGTDIGGTLPLGNGLNGVVCFANSTNNTIGGTAAGAGNTIAFNNSNGVLFLAGSANAILGNSIFSNGGLGIDLNDDGGVTPNDPCDTDPGANNSQNFPNLTSAQAIGANTVITGTLNSTANTSFRIEFFANASCDASGFGEGRSFLGATVVTTNGTCNASINASLSSSMPVGQVITATATDPGNNTSEFSNCVQVVAAVCSLKCPNDIVRATIANTTSCGTPMDFSVATTGTCGPVNCVPPAGSFFPVGTTSVTCTAAGGSSCSFNVTVIDNTPPKISCPGTTLSTLPAGQASAVVQYPQPTVTDNCPGATVLCSPPSGATFPAGTTAVTCTATDASSNFASCFFSVVVQSSQVPLITCPPNVSVTPAAGQTSVTLNYPAPTVSSSLPGTTVLCLPGSGTSFPLGVTTITCTATDVAGNKSSCSFTATVGGPQARVIIPNDKSMVEFGNPTPVSPTRKPPKVRKNPCQLFSVQNVGFAPLVLTFDSITRIGSDVDSKKIANQDDTRYFTLNLVEVAVVGTTPIDPGAVITIQAGGTQQFCLRFAALIPALAGKTTGVAAADALPDTVTSTVNFRQNAGSPLSVNVLSHLTTAVIFINPINPRQPPGIRFTRSGNDLTVSYALYDPNLDVSRAKYEFLDNSGQVVGSAFEIDLTEQLRALNLVRGQSFAVEQRFTGAADHPEIVGVRVTVTDGEGSVTDSASAASKTIASFRLLNRMGDDKLYLPVARLSAPLP